LTTADPSVTAATDDGDVRYAALRDARYEARRLLWKVTQLRRVAYCGRVLRDKSQPVTFVVTGTPGQAGARAGVRNVQACGSVWVCPVCSEKVNASRRNDIQAGIESWIAAGNTVVFGTFTMKHKRCTKACRAANKGECEHSLKAMWNAISPSWNKVTGGPQWSGAKPRRPGADRTIGDRERFDVAGYLRIVEVKYGWSHGWHPHIHALFFLRGQVTDERLEEMRSRFFGRWSAALAKHGYTALEFDRDPKSPTFGQPVGVDLRRVKDAGYMAEYFAKHGYLPKQTTSAGGAAYEVTGSHTKRAGKGGRSPFEILAGLVLRDREKLVDGMMIDTSTGEVISDSRDQDLAIWLEWEQASKGRLQMTWSRGLRDLLGLDRELTDEEIVELEDAGGVEFADKRHYVNFSAHCIR